MLMIDPILVDLIDQKTNLEKLGFSLPKEFKSKCYALCGSCGKPILTSYMSLRRTVKRRGSYTCGPCVSRSESGRAARSNQAKSLWANEEKSKIVAEKSKLHANSEEGRKQRSKQAKEAWQDANFAEFQKNRISALFKSDKHRKLVSERNKRVYSENPEKYIEDKVSVLHTKEARVAHKKALADPKYREVHKQLAKTRMADPEMRAKISKSLENFPRGGRMSSPELVISGILKNMGLDFVYNKSIGPYNFDFYIEKFDLFIEVQGEYWHTLPNNEARDRSKYKYIRTAFPDSKLMYIWDYDLLTGNAEKKISEITGYSSYPTLDFEFDDLKFSEVDTNTSKKFLNSWHYAQYGKMQKFSFGAFLNEDLIAIAKFGPVSRVEIATSLGKNSSDTFELDRFCIHPMRHKKNFASHFLSHAASAFFSKFITADTLVSFADTTFGHTGSIYKACGWSEVSKVSPDYVYVNDSGWMMHKKTLYNHARSVHMSERDYAQKNGWRKVFGKEKLKFVLYRK